MLERGYGLVLFALDLEDGEKRDDAMVSRVKSRGPASPFPEVHFPEGEMEKRESDLFGGRYDLHYAGAGDTKEKRESLYFRSDSGVFGSAAIMSPRPTLSRRAALCCATVLSP